MAEGGYASLVEIREPLAALIIASQAFLTTLTEETYRKITLSEIQAALRQAFCNQDGISQKMSPLRDASSLHESGQPGTA